MRRDGESGSKYLIHRGCPPSVYDRKYMCLEHVDAQRTETDDEAIIEWEKANGFG